MKNVFFSFFCITLFFSYTNCVAQITGSVKTLQIIDFTEYPAGYVIQTKNITNGDTTYTVSLKGELDSTKDYIKMVTGSIYNFEIVDIDTAFSGGSFPAALPNGYTVRFLDKAIKRESRNGKTLNTTQFFSINSVGLYIIKTTEYEE